MKDIKGLAQRAYKLGQISGKCFVAKNRLENLIKSMDFGENESVMIGVKDVIKIVDEISKLSKEIDNV